MRDQLLFFNIGNLSEELYGAIRNALACQLLEAGTQIAVAGNPQLGFRDALEHQRPGFNHLPVSLVVLALVEPADHEHCRRPSRTRRGSPQAGARAQMDCSMRHALEIRIAGEKPAPGMVAV